ncbi:MAG: sugar phosphate isomerase/epimerase [Spirochaetales bacterium]|nr:sugar phosphate isomerase/epimerase [Spirochaetales bacterium]
MLKHALITGFLGMTKDRFHTYNHAKTVEEKFDMVSKLEGINGVEIVYPYEVQDPQETKRLIDAYGLEIAAINVNVKAEPEFKNGGLTSPKKEVREKAVRFIKQAKDFAEAVGADKVTCCPLGDGYEFAFQADYGEMWNRLEETFTEAGSYKPSIPLFIEYKPSETRGSCYLDSAATTLNLLNRIGIKEMGVTIDFGHSIYGGNTPAEEVSLIEHSPFPYYVHINDNDGKWDWDYFCGTKHFLEYVEFLYYLKKYAYNDFLTSDTSPTRWDIKKTFEINSRITGKIETLLENGVYEELKESLAAEDYLKTWSVIEEKVFNLV